MDPGIFYWDKLENPINVITVKAISSEIILTLISLIMKINGKFFSITNSEDEMTICYDASIDITFDHIPLSSDSMPIYKDIYVAYKLINTGSLIEEAGLVKKVSSLFSDREIPIMYLTTYNNDYVLVPKNYEADADNIVNIVNF